METELKLQVNQQAREQLQAHPLLKKYAISEPHVDQISDNYFDTPDLNLRQHDANLRVRHLGNTWLQTLKAGDSSAIGGLYQRQEWESRISGPNPNLASLRALIRKNTPWTSLLRSKSLEHNLKPIFSSEVTRTVWELRLPSGDEIVSSLDDGRLECNGQMLNISEFELELKSGKLAHLVDFALTLQQDIPLVIGSMSKAERGYALLQPQAATAVKATALNLSRQMSPAQAFVEIASNCLVQIKANQDGALQRSDAESLHQLRIGLLRLRSAIKAFRGKLLLPQALHQDITWLASQLSEARDWDVLSGSTLPELMRQVPNESGLFLLRHAVEEKTHETHKKIFSVGLDPRFTKLVLELTRLVQEGGLIAQQDTSRRLLTLSRKLITRTHKRIQKRSQPQGVDQKARHLLRAAVKTARYECEFFQSICKRSKPYIKALSVLQEALGRQNDALIADKLLQELEKQPGNNSGGAEFARGYLIKQAEGEEISMRKVLKTFAKLKI